MLLIGLGLLASGGCTGASPHLGDSAPAASDSGTGADSGLDAAVGCPEPTLDPSTPSHAADIQPIWSSRCSTCHTSSSNGGLSLANAYEHIVDVPSSALSSMDLIEPGDLDRSYLWRKLTDSHEAVGGAGDWMPRGGQELSSDECDRIASWIAGGAPP